MSQALGHRSRLPDSAFGDNRCIEVHPFGGDALLHVWQGALDRDLLRDHEGVAGFRISHTDIPLFIAAIYGYYSRLKASPEMWQKLSDQTRQAEASRRIWPPQTNLLGRVARGEFQEADLDITKRRQYALAPRLSRMIGTYLTVSEDGSKSFVLLAHDNHEPEGRVLHRARFVPQDIPQLAGMISRLSDEETQTEVGQLSECTLSVRP